MKRLALPVSGLLLALLALAAPRAVAEGSSQLGAYETLIDKMEFYVDVVPGEVINLSAYKVTNNAAANGINAVITLPSGDNVVRVFSDAEGFTSSPVPATITNPNRYTAVERGVHRIVFNHLTDGVVVIPLNAALRAWDVTVTPNATTPVVPATPPGGVGRLFSKVWWFCSTAMTTHFYMPVPNGCGTGDVLWDFDIKAMDGNCWSAGSTNQGIAPPYSNASNRGVLAPPAKLRAPLTTYREYLTKPAVGTADCRAPSAALTEFRAAPCGGGEFTFTTNQMGTYDITIDTNNDHKFDPAQDAVISGVVTTPGTIKAYWDGRGRLDVDIAPGAYAARLVFRTSELHMRLGDIEYNTTGVSLWRIDPVTKAQVSTQQWWDDRITIAGAAAGDIYLPTLVIDAGEPSSTKHRWGNSVGNNSAMDTYTAAAVVMSTRDITVSAPTCKLPLQCSPTTNTCVECVSDAHCPPTKPICRLTTSKCNTNPLLNAMAYTVRAGRTLDVDIKAQAIDPDLTATPPDQLTFSGTFMPRGSSLNTSTGAFHWATTAATTLGTYKFPVEVSDGLASASREVTITVVANKPPVLTQPTNISVAEGLAVNLQLAATDPDLDALTYSFTSTPVVNASYLNATTGLLSVPAGLTLPTTYNVSWNVSDGLLADKKSSTITITPRTPTKLVFTQQPVSRAADQAFPAVTVSAQDASNVTVGSYTGNITLAIGNNPVGGALTGTLTVAAVNGVATFDLWKITKAGTGYTLTAAAASTTGTTSTAFNVTAGKSTKLAFVQQPSNVAANASITPAVTVAWRDAYDNLATTAVGTVTLALVANPGNSRFGGANAVAAVGGVATFSDLTLDKVGTGYTLGATSGSVTTTSTAFNVTPGPVTKLGFTVQPPASTVAGTAMTPAVAVTAYDARNNVVTGYTGTITLAITTNPGGGTLSGTPAKAAAAGVATYADLKIDKAGVGYVLTASAPNLTSAVTTAFTITAGEPAMLAFTVQPSSATSGVSLSPPVKVTVQDALGNTVPTAVNTITVAIGTNPSSGVLGGTLVVNAVAGTATFATLTIDKAGTGYTLKATATGVSKIVPVISTPFNIATGAANKLVFTQQPPTTVVAGAAMSVKVAVQDNAGNTTTTSTAAVTIALVAHASGGVLTGTRTVNAVAGIATFTGLSIDKTGNDYTLKATGTGFTEAVSTQVDVTAGAANKLAFTVQPAASTVAGATLAAVAVTVLDVLGNKVPTAVNDITVAIAPSPPAAGTLGGTKLVKAVAGASAFSTLTVDKAGVGYKLTATATGLVAATSTAFTIVAGTPNKLLFTVPPANVVAGATMTAVKAAVVDALGNVCLTSTAAVTLGINNNPGPSTLTGGAAVAAVAGVASFAGISLNKTGTGYTLSASTGGLTSATSTAFNVTAGVANKLAFTVQPAASTVAGATLAAIAVAVQDALGNTVPTAVNAITVALNPTTGVLGGTQVVNAVAGTSPFSTLTVNKAGVGYTLAATAAGLTAATSSAFTILAGAPSKLAFTVQPSNVVAGVVMAPAVKAAVLDALGNVCLTSSAQVSLSFATNPGASALTGGAAITAVAGVATFAGLSLNKTGTGYRLNVNSTGLTTAASNTFNVTAGVASKLAFTVQPAASTASGVSISPAIKVAVQDALSNTVTTAVPNITLVISTNPASGVLGGTTTIKAVAGVATFSTLTIDKAGNGYKVTATSTGLTNAISNAFNIVVGAATKLVFTVQPPTSVAAGAAMTVKVAVQDNLGNTNTTSTAELTIELVEHASGGVIAGVTSVDAVAGVATFTGLSLNKVGNDYTLKATGTSTTGIPYTEAVSTPVDVTPGPAAALAFIVQPGATKVHLPIEPAMAVAVLDANGNTVTGSTASVTLAIGANPGTSTLAGTQTKAANAGIATFPGVALDHGGVGYTLVASAPLTAADPASTTSVEFEVIDTPPTLTATTPALIDEGVELAVLPVFADEDGDTVTLTAENLPVGAVLDPARGLVWTPTFVQSGSYVVHFVATANGVTSSFDLTIEVADVNRPPVFVSLEAPPANEVDAFEFTVNEGDSLVIEVTADDPDEDTLSYAAHEVEVEGLPVGVTVDAATGDLSWAPEYDQSGDYQIEISVGDGRGGVARQEISIQVVEVNRPPVLTAIGAQTVKELGLLTFPTSAVDADGDTLTYTAHLQGADGLPAGATYALASDVETFTWTPTQQQAGPYTIVFTVTDGRGGEDHEDVVVTVENVNRPPVFEPVADIETEGPGSFTFLVSDPDSDTLTCEAVDLPPGATLDAENRSVSWPAGISVSAAFVAKVKCSDGLVETTLDVNIRARLYDRTGGGLAGCGCGSSPPEALAGLFALSALLLRRRRQARAD